MDMDTPTKGSIKQGFFAAGMLGVFGAVVFGGVTALFSGPVALMATIGVGIFGTFGAMGAAVGAATSVPGGNAQAGIMTGLATTALLALGVHAALDKDTFNKLGKAFEKAAPAAVQPEGSSSGKEKARISGPSENHPVQVMTLARGR